MVQRRVAKHLELVVVERVRRMKGTITTIFYFTLFVRLHLRAFSVMYPTFRVNQYQSLDSPRVGNSRNIT